MSYSLSERSLSRLEGVDENLVAVVKRAIEVTTIDFGVTEGLRSLETQERYVAAGKSQTMKSKHLDGKAVDLMAYLYGKPCWELTVYDEIADAMRTAAKEVGIAIRWGCAWNVPDIRDWNGSMEELMNFYIDERRQEGRRPFLDGPHFELID